MDSEAVMSLPVKFRRLFSCNFRKNLILPLASMPFSTDFVHAERGDPASLTEKTGDCTENVSAGIYTVTGEHGTVSRLIGAYAPYATYEMRLNALSGAAGFTFRRGEECFRILTAQRDGKLTLLFENGAFREEYASETVFVPGCRVLVTSRKEFLDCYADTGNGYPVFLHTFRAEGWEENLRYQQKFRDVKVFCTVRGSAVLSSVRVYMDCGIAQADIRPVRYENGRAMIEDGKLYLTMSIRMEAECYSGVFSWVPGTECFALVGALFFDSGDGLLGNDVASSILYDRRCGKWYLWVCAFSHGHILAHAELDADPRFGVNIIDYRLSEPMREGDDDTVLRGKQGDEDPDFLYDEKTGFWYLTICRLTQTEEGIRYRYHLFRSKQPFDGYAFITRSAGGDETGGSLLLRQDGLYFVCGSSFVLRSRYHIYHLPDMTSPVIPSFDYDDGGFRGWGTYIPVLRGTRETVYHLTFDRERGSDYNWSYGNLYCFLPE